MQASNQQIAKILRDVAAAYIIKKTGNVFEIRAYENAADNIEHSTSEIKDLWEERKLVKSGVISLGDLKSKIIKGDRMLLPYAFAQAQRILDYLKKSKDVLEVHSLGSLRRMVATIADLDFSASSKNPQKVVDYFCQMPGIDRIIEKGDTRATIILQSGLQVDILVGQPESYGALLQHFTGSKAHNIKLRTLAQANGLTLSEHTKTKTEEEFYKLLNMDIPASEIREDTGEIEASLNHKLPKLVEIGDIRGDLHLHSNYPIKSPSHGPGADSIEEIVKKAIDLGYEYVGISDHPPGFTSVSKEEIISWVQKRAKVIQSMNTKSIRVLNGLEIDILGNGDLSVPDEALETLDYCIAGIHSGHRNDITKRLMLALQNPHVDIVSHPTNRLLNERDSSEADW